MNCVHLFTSIVDYDVVLIVLNGILKVVGLVLENCELAVIVLHDGVKGDDEAIEVDQHHVESNTLQNSVEKISSRVQCRSKNDEANHFKKIEENDHDNSVDDIDLNKPSSSLGNSNDANDRKHHQRSRQQD